jgi:ADP-heptose:LPS heptosyltransferase
MKTLVSLEQRFETVSGVAQSAMSVLFTTPVRWLGGYLRRSQVRGMEREFDPRTVKSILLTRVDGIGDLVLFSSLMREVRGLWPHAHITLVVDQRFASFVEECPYSDEVIGFNERGSKFARLFTGPWRAYRLAKQRLWRRRYDLAISPRWDFDTRHAAVLGFLSLPRYHFGFSETVSSRKRALNYGCDALFTHVVPSKPGVRHEIERNAEMLAALGGNPARIHNLELWLSESDRSYARQILAKNGVTAGPPLIGLGIGATQAKRRWPIARFGALAEWLVKTYNARILVVGDSVDACDAEHMRPILGSAMINQAGVCNVRQSAALLSFCYAFIGNDSGPMHLAAASNVPVIELSCHPQTASQNFINSPLRYAPLSVWARVIQPAPLSEECQQACNDSEAHCILNLHMRDVQEVADELMNDLVANSAKRSNCTSVNQYAEKSPYS